MERKIGEIFEYEGEWYQCVYNIHGNCDGCSFSRLNSFEYGSVCCESYLVEIHGKCGKVIFKKLEKVGEPYEFQKRTIQTYKLYMEPFISVDMDFIWAYVRGSNTIDIIIKQNKEDMEEKNQAKHSNSKKIGKNLKEFDLEAAKAGKPVCTRDGHKARIICFDRKFYHNGCNYPIVAAINEYNDNDNEFIYSYTQDGLFIENNVNELDLMMLPEKRSGWVNVYNNPTTNNIYTSADVFESKEIAEEQGTQRNRIATCKITWEE